MIESRLDPSVDGLSQLSTHKELTVAATADTFRILAKEGGVRSVSSVLRIVAEQSQQSQGRDAHPGGRAPINGIVALSPLTAICLWAWVTGASPHPRLVLTMLVGLGLLNTIFARAAWKGRKRKLRYRAQSDELRRLALEALETIVLSPRFVPKPLDREERRTLRSLRRSAPEAWSRVEWVLVGEDT